MQECHADPNHALWECPRFAMLPVLKKWAFVRENRICDYYLGHTLSFLCWRAASRHGRSPCEVDRCTGHHHTLLHTSSDCAVVPSVSQKQVMGARWLAEGWRKPIKEKFRFRP
jgi:hypothetical protein